MAYDPEAPEEGARDLARALREEVDRVRIAERSAQRAVEELGWVRQRLEALVGESLAREVAEAPPAAEPVELVEPEPPDTPDSRFVLVLTGMMIVLLIAASAGWIALQGRWADTSGREVAERGGVEVADVGSRVDEELRTGGEDVEDAAPAAPLDTEETVATAARAVLPDAPEERAVLYDSLFEARSELFHPLLDSLTEATGSDEVEDAVGAWREGAFLGPLAADRLHSALLQLVLRRETGASIALDGQVLRNPCRGASCGALLELWESDGERLGLPEMPEDVARSTADLEMAERVLLLHALGG